jgi:hypothetical protein
MVNSLSIPQPGHQLAAGDLPDLALIPEPNAAPIVIGDDFHDAADVAPHLGPNHDCEITDLALHCTLVHPVTIHAVPF